MFAVRNNLEHFVEHKRSKQTASSTKKKRKRTRKYIKKTEGFSADIASWSTKVNCEGHGQRPPPLPPGQLEIGWNSSVSWLLFALLDSRPLILDQTLASSLTMTTWTTSRGRNSVTATRSPSLSEARISSRAVSASILHPLFTLSRRS